LIQLIGKSHEFFRLSLPEHAESTIPGTVSIPFQPRYGLRDLGRRASELRSVCKRFDIELLHAHTLRAGLLATWAPYYNRIPVVYTGHGLAYLHQSRAWKRLSFRGIEAFVSRSSRACVRIAPHEQVRALKDRVDGCANSHLIVTQLEHRAFEELRQPASNDSLVAVTIATVEERKGLSFFLELARESLGAGRPYKFVWYGRGPLLEHARSIARRIDPEGSSILFPGSIPRSEVPLVLAAADVFLLLSHAETLSLSLIEAGFAARATLVAPFGGVEDIIADPCQGIVLPAWNVPAALDGLARLEAPNARHSFGAALHERTVAHFGLPDVMGTAYDEIYRSAGH
jgi:glycosyltransferase involved in cell wall biosynthesis